jgi:hypothetical protein
MFCQWSFKPGELNTFALLLWSSLIREMDSGAGLCVSMLQMVHSLAAMMVASLVRRASNS